MENIQPIVPEGTPLPTPPVGVPPFPITPFAVWTWSTPVIPEFYWNVYSSEQRIKQICKEIGRIEAYLNYLVNETNKNIIEIHRLITELTERVAQLEKHVEEEVARLDGLIAQLRADLEQEIADREAGDTALGERIDQEILDRTHGDQTLHEEIAQEVRDRTHADDLLHEEISTETQARIHADDALHDEISHRLLPTDLQAGEEISITRPDPNSNTIVIASTVAHSIADLASTVSGLQAALTSETDERRADDSKLWVAVNNRIERGKILAGTGIKVENDPDASTVTISATGGGTGGTTTVEGTAPVEVNGSPEEGYNVSVSAATEEEPGVITEARVKELAGEAGGSTTTVSGTAPVEVSGTPEAGYTVGVSQATESAAGVITEARVKELASGPSLSAEEPLKIEDGTLGLSIDQDTMEVTDGKLAVKPAALTGLNPNYGFLQNAMYPSAQINAGELFGFLKRTSGTANGQLLPTTLGTSRDLTLRHHSESFYKTDPGTYGGGWISPTDAQDTADLVTYGAATGISWDEAQQGKAVTDCRMKVMNLKLVYWAKDGEESNTTYADYEAFKLFEQRTFTKMTEERGVWDKPYYRVAKEDKEGRVLKAVSFDFLLFYDLWVSSELLRFSGE